MNVVNQKPRNDIPEAGRIKHGNIPKNDRDLVPQTYSSESSHQLMARQKWNKENATEEKKTKQNGRDRRRERGTTKRTRVGGRNEGRQ